MNYLSYPRSEKYNLLMVSPSRDAQQGSSA